MINRVWYNNMLFSTVMYLNSSCVLKKHTQKQRQSGVEAFLVPFSREGAAN